MASELQITEFITRESMAAFVTDVVATALKWGVNDDGCAEFAVSGGSTPQAHYEMLAQRDLPWPNIRISLVDERWVPLDHARSNEAFIRRAFGHLNTEIVGLYNRAVTPEKGLDQTLKQLDRRTKPFDVVVLGMGPDGHTASWFPHAEGLRDALTSDAHACAIMARQSAVTGEEVIRMTMTLSALKDARRIVLLMTGEEKKKVLATALEDGTNEAMPVRAILRARPDMIVAWAP